jgi:Spy/CpxP family protein refolding chaperone
MTSKLHWLCVAAVVACGSFVKAAPPANHPASTVSSGNSIDTLLFPPDAVLRNREKLGLTDQQVEEIKSGLHEAGSKSEELQQRAALATGRLAELIAAGDVDEEAAVKLLDDLLAVEKDQKRLHLRVMIRVRNKLTPEQRRIAAKMQQDSASQKGVEERLKEKMSRIQQAVQSRAEAGDPPSDVVAVMQKFPELMRNGQPREAEALLDRVIAMLGGAEPGKKPGTQPGGTRPSASLPGKVDALQKLAKERQQNGGDVSKIGELMQKLGPLLQQNKFDEAEKVIDKSSILKGALPGPDNSPKPGKSPKPRRDEARRLPKDGLIKQTSFDDVRAEVDAMKVQDVEWRKIAWKTCLLDGLKASREQKKPIMLWVFIDRPIDDERC